MSVASDQQIAIDRLTGFLTAHAKNIEAWLNVKNEETARQMESISHLKSKLTDGELPTPELIIDIVKMSEEATYELGKRGLPPIRKVLT